MALSVFDNPSAPPQPAALKRALGRAAGAWTRLIAEAGRAHGPLEEQWNFAGARFGWSLRLRKCGAIALYLTPQAGAFLVGLVLGEKAVTAASEAGLPDAVQAAVDAAPRYAEGRGLRLEVKSATALPAILTLLDAKMSTTQARAPRKRAAR
jgi:hypothetical protein